MRNSYLFLALIMTLSVTAWAQTRTADVNFAYSSTPGLWKPAKAYAQVVENDGSRVLEFRVEGKRTDSVDLDNNIMGAFGKITAVKIISYTDYSARAAAEENRHFFERKMPEIYFYKPVIVLEEEGKTHLYTVNQSGELTRVFETGGTSAVLQRVGLKDRDGILNYIDLDLIKIGTVYYSPELKGTVNKDQIVIVKQDSTPNELTTSELVALREFNSRAADEYEAADRAVREERFVYPTVQERDRNALLLSRLVISSDPRDALFARRIHSRNLAVQGRIIPQSDRFSAMVRNNAEKFREAVANARRYLNQVRGVRGECDRHLKSN